VASGPAGRRPAVGCFLVIGLLVVLGILFALIQDASQHPVAAGFGLFAFVAVSVLLIVLWWRRRIRLHRQQQGRFRRCKHLLRGVR
jgi:membrane protein implicated in regulation of membrane protease activity